MVGVYRVFRAFVTFVVGAIFLALFAGFLLDRFAEGSALEGVNEDWNPLTLVELVPVFWPTLLFLTGLTIGMQMDAFALRPRKPRSRRAPLEFVYDPSDHRFVHQEFPNGGLKPVTRFTIGLHNTTNDRVLQDIIVTARRGAFVKAVIEPAWGGRRQTIARIEPKTTAFVDILGLPDDFDTTTGIGSKARRFIIRASASDTRRTSARFVFNARANPVMRRLL
jgi:hypothetical protein